MSADYIIPFGKKYKGKRIGDIPRGDLQSFIEWLEKSDIKSNSFMEKHLKELKAAVAALQPVAPAAEEPQALGPKGRKPNTNKNDPYRGSRANGAPLRLYFTNQGTELPLINLKGKEYLEVKFRLVWFREEHPDWSIETEFVSVTENSAFAKATVRDEKGRVIATSHKMESLLGFPDFAEKAETGAIGRALAIIGYGTQFCADDMAEGDRQVDDGVGRGRNPSEPVVPTVENGPVVAIELKERDQKAEKKLRASGFTFDWPTSRWLRYYDDRIDFDSLGFEYEVLEKPAFKD